MAERKSSPRHKDVEVDDSALKRRERMFLIALGFGGIAVVFLMMVISGFLSQKETPTVGLIGFGITVVIGAVMMFLGYRTGKK